MNKALLHDDVQEFIRSYEDDLSKLAFKGSPFPEVSTQELLEQIFGVRRCEKKLPSWYNTPNLLYPPKLNLEQTSSETTANYKANLISGKTIADLTGGFGVDSYAFSKNFDRVYYFEQNEKLAEMAAYNFTLLGAENIETCAGDGLKSIEHMTFDVIYLDPARRDERKGKIFRLSDGEPNVVDALPFLLERCDTLLIKSSPMLDLSEGMRELEMVREVHVVAVQNEVKEVLWILDKLGETPMIHAINFTSNSLHQFSFEWGKSSNQKLGDPLTYIYEPNAAIMKSGGMNYVTDAYPLLKLSANAHLYTSDSRIDFPGRCFRLLEVRSYGKKVLNDFRKKKAHITTRDFPLSVAELRKRWQIIEGGNLYLFFTTLQNGDKAVLLSEKA